MSELILASMSRTRHAMLKSAGVDFAAMRPTVDEDALKDSLLSSQTIHPRDLALRLAEAKALSLSTEPGKLVIGADQTLSHHDRLFNKATDEADLRAKLRVLRGETHHLHAAVACACAGQIIYRHVEDASLAMRRFSDDFLESYLNECGKDVLSSVGGYHLEGAGIQLFERVEGSYFTILGLPLLPLLAFLREHGKLAS